MLNNYAFLFSLLLLSRGLAELNELYVCWLLVREGEKDAIRWRGRRFHERP